MRYHYAVSDFVVHVVSRLVASDKVKMEVHDNSSQRSCISYFCEAVGYCNESRAMPKERIEHTNDFLH